MAFIPKSWQDNPSHGTPINAASLKDIEERLAAYAQSVSEAQAQASLPTVLASLHGAKGDAQVVFDAAITTGTKTLTSTSGLFKSGDVGKSVRLQNAGAGSINEKRTLTTTGEPTGGTFTVRIGGEPTVALPYNATIGEVKTAIEAVPIVGASNVEVTGIPGAWVIEFINSLGKQPIESFSAPTIFTGGTTPNITVTRTTTGVSAWYEGEITGFNSATSVTLAANALTTVTGSELIWGTDDTQAINAAGAYVSEQGGGTVELNSTSEYFISYKETTKLDGITHWGLRMYSNHRLKGGVLHFPSYTNGGWVNFMVPEGTVNAHIEKVEFNGHYLNQIEVEHTTIRLFGCENISVTECTSKHYGTKFLFATKSSTSPENRNIRVERNEIHHHAGNAIGINGAEFVWIIGNYAHDVQTPDTAEWCIGNQISHVFIEQNIVRRWGNTNLCYNEGSNAYFLFVRNNDFQTAVTGAIAMVSIGAGGSSIAEHCHVDNNTLDTSLRISTPIPEPIKFAAGTVEYCSSDNNDIIMYEGAAIDYTGSTVLKHISCRGNRIKVTNPEGTAYITLIGGEGNVINDNSVPGSIITGNYDFVSGNNCQHLEIGSHCVIGPNVVLELGLRINGSFNTLTGGYYSLRGTSSNGAIMIYNEGSHNHFIGVSADRPDGENLRHFYVIGTGGDNTFEACPCLGVKPGVTLGTGIGNRVRRCPGVGANGAGVGTAEIAIGLTSVEITHNMGYTPVSGEIDITPISNPGGQYWVTNITAEKFKINISVTNVAIVKFGYVIA